MPEPSASPDAHHEPARRVALVTGASRGLGREVALHLARSGHDVVVNYRRHADLAAEVVAEVEAEGVRALAVPADVADPDAVRALTTTAAERLGRIDVLVANAAATAFKPLVDLSADNVRRTFDLVVGGFVQLVQGSVPHMRRGGRVVAVSGIDSVRYMPDHGLLGAAKAAMESLVRSFAVELGPAGITVNAISPGGFETESSRIWGGSKFDVMKERFSAQSAVKDYGTCADMAHAIDYLVSPGARFLTGQPVVVDGGLTVNLADLDALHDATRAFEGGFALATGGDGAVGSPSSGATT